MAVISTFDQWQKDIFFSAAEEVQESADTMESVYRMWLRERSDASDELEILDELQRELYTTLGTAKWQLEEFEKAVNLSYENFSSEDNTRSRHREFVGATRNKISHIEDAIKVSLREEGKQPFRWVQLDEEEKDDFENFLSMAPKKLQGQKEKHSISESVQGFKETVSINNDAEEPFRDEIKANGDNLNGQKAASKSPDIGPWKIVIADGEDADDKRLLEAKSEVLNHASSSLRGFLACVGSTVKLKWARHSFGKVKSGEHIQSRRGFSNYLDLKKYLFPQGISGLTERTGSCFCSRKDSSRGGINIQEVGRVSGLPRPVQSSRYIKRSLRVSLLLVLTIFLVAPFLVYST